jgi:hypothetical protein
MIYGTAVGFKGLGLGTLKQQQEHYDKVFKSKHPNIPPELQELFDYGTKQEINALATLLYTTGER